MLSHPLAIASGRDATIHGLYVLDRRRYTAAPDGQTDEIVAELEGEWEAALSELAEIATDEGIQVVTERSTDFHTTASSTSPRSAVST